MSTFTTSKNLEQVARGADPGVWDTPTNSNWGIVDAALGQFTLVTLNNSPVVLAPAQYQCNFIGFVSTLSGNVTVTFPASYIGPYTVNNACTGSSAFVITLATTVAGGAVVGCPPGTFDIYNSGFGIQIKNFGRIGEYMDYAGSSVPAWISACSPAPYLNCDGTAFSSATYPFLTVILGGTTLPDRRGTAGYTLNQGTGRITAASGGLDGNTAFATKVSQTVTIGTPNLPAYTPSGTVTGTANNGAILLYNGFGGQNLAAGTNGFGWSNNPTISALSYTLSAAFAGVAQGGVSNPMSAIGTGTVYGICMIRAG